MIIKYIFNNMILMNFFIITYLYKVKYWILLLLSTYCYLLHII